MSLIHIDSGALSEAALQYGTGGDAYITEGTDKHAIVGALAANGTWTGQDFSVLHDNSAYHMTQTIAHGEDLLNRKGGLLNCATETDNTISATTALAEMCR